MNDTAKATVTISPDFNVRIKPISEQNRPASARMLTQTIVVVRNTGNMELPAIDLKLSVDTNSQSYFTATKSLNQPLLPGDSVEVTFDDAYNVPWIYEYTVEVHGYLSCDTALLDDIDSKQEYVDMNDLYLVDILRPAANEIDTIGSEKAVSVQIQNRNIGNAYDAGEVRIRLLITDTTHVPKSSVIIEELPAIGSGAGITYHFSGKYTVPSLPAYLLKVYIESADQYLFNDTLTMRRVAVDKPTGILEHSSRTFSMEQNIPNPANDKTVINYSIPQDGEINFTIYSVSGQVLYNNTENVPLGEHQLELNISDYASGVYFYVMEYQGQRITKRMSIKR
jgi:hypothetical protein